MTVDTLFRQAGVIRTDTMHELFDVGALLAAQPAPAGPRVAIVTNAGGPGILCADACQGAGLDVVELSPAVRERLASLLAPEASLGNPIDMIATAPAASYRRTIETLVQERACDAILAIFVPPLATRARDVAREIHIAAARTGGVALAAVFMTSEGTPPELSSPATRVPSFAFPEDGARAIAHAARYGRWRAQPLGRLPALEDLRPEDATVVIAQALVHDESFGPVIACGAGGTSAEIAGDAQVRITPLTDLDAREMLRALRMFPLLDGYRGAPPCDVATLENILLRLSALVEAHPEVAELDANPVVAGPDGAVIVDARVRLAAVPPHRPLASL